MVELPNIFNKKRYFNMYFADIVSYETCCKCEQFCEKENSC